MRYGRGSRPAEHSTEAVHGVHARQQRAAVAVLDTDPLVIHRDIDDAVGRRRQADGHGQDGQVRRVRDRQQQPREDGQPDQQCPPTAEPGDDDSAELQPEDGAGIETEKRDGELPVGQAELAPSAPGCVPPRC